MNLQQNLKQLTHLDIKDALEFIFVFGSKLPKKSYSNVFEAIECEILNNFELICSDFDFSKEIKQFLMKLARGDRKRFNLVKFFPRKLGRKIINDLCNDGLIGVEKSLEVKPKRPKNQKLKRSIRRYQIQDKIYFIDNFYRFWFYFCEPNLFMLKNDVERILQIIKDDFEHYCSFCFELACRELLCYYLNMPKCAVSSYWDKNSEIDIVGMHDGFCVVAEVKYKDRKMCKNVLNLLLRKCQNCNINPNLIMLFSKSGFSRELLNLSGDKILLFDLDSFKEIR